jgi:flavin-binding protein dodecin
MRALSRLVAFREEMDGESWSPRMNTRLEIGLAFPREGPVFRFIYDTPGGSVFLLAVIRSRVRLSDEGGNWTARGACRTMQSASGSRMRPDRRSFPMAVARVTEIIAGSEKSFDDAIKQGIERANKTLSKVEGAWIKDQSLILDDGKIKEYRVIMNVTFVLKD